MDNGCLISPQVALVQALGHPAICHSVNFFCLTSTLIVVIRATLVSVMMGHHRRLPIKEHRGLVLSVGEATHKACFRIRPTKRCIKPPSLMVCHHLLSGGIRIRHRHPCAKLSGKRLHLPAPKSLGEPQLRLH